MQRRTSNIVLAVAAWAAWAACTSGGSGESGGFRGALAAACECECDRGPDDPCVEGCVGDRSRAANCEDECDDDIEPTTCERICAGWVTCIQRADNCGEIEGCDTLRAGLEARDYRCCRDDADCSGRGEVCRRGACVQDCSGGNECAAAESACRSGLCVLSGCGPGEDRLNGTDCELFCR